MKIEVSLTQACNPSCLVVLSGMRAIHYWCNGTDWCRIFELSVYEGIVLYEEQCKTTDVAYGTVWYGTYIMAWNVNCLAVLSCARVLRCRCGNDRCRFWYVIMYIMLCDVPGAVLSGTRAIRWIESESIALISPEIIVSTTTCLLQQEISSILY